MLFLKKDWREFQLDGELDIDFYEDDNISLEECGEGDILDKLIIDGEKVDFEDEDYIICFDLLEDFSEYKLDKGKVNYVKMYFKFYFIEDKSQKVILEIVFVLVNSFLMLLELDDYIFDIIGEVFEVFLNE